jgi:hypothetical protein
VSSFRRALLRWLAQREPDLKRRHELIDVYWWLKAALPEVWYDRSDEESLDMAEALVTLRSGVEGGRWGKD